MVKGKKKGTNQVEHKWHIKLGTMGYYLLNVSKINARLLIFALNNKKLNDIEVR
jgi:hypothetical protein